VGSQSGSVVLEQLVELQDVEPVKETSRPSFRNKQRVPMGWIGQLKVQSIDAKFLEIAVVATHGERRFRRSFWMCVPSNVEFAQMDSL
jgi:hypothetical protein